MAVTYTVQEDAGILTHKGQNGFVRANLIHDGSTATKQIALASTSSIKTILAVFGGNSSDCPTVGGVIATTGPTIKFTADTSALLLSILIYGTA